MTQHNKNFCGSCRLIYVCLLSAFAFISVAGQHDQIKTVESTTAYQLFTIEGRVHQVPANADTLLRTVIEDATAAALKTNRRPQTGPEVLRAFDAIQISLEKHNFMQPPQEKDWPQTLGDALKPLSSEKMKEGLGYPTNFVRKKYFDLTKPFYFVDCDMGSEIFLAVGERLGWDIRLVELPQHNFVRWHLSATEKINWDWVAGMSIDDGSYRSEQSTDVRWSIFYMRSLEIKEATAYYLGLIGSEADKPSDAERLLLEAIAVIPMHPLTLNNLAWLYATDPGFARDKSKSNLAVAYGLAAWSTRPDHGNFADTVACAQAAIGQKALAAATESFAIEHPSNENQRQGFRENLARINAGELCK